MPNLRDVGLHISNYKSFGPEGGGFDSVYPINIIIGRNNSGKSALLDAIAQVREWVKIPSHLNYAGGIPSFKVSKHLVEAEIERVFRKGEEGGMLIRGRHWEDAGNYLVGSRITIEKTDTDLSFISLYPDLSKKQ